MAEKFSLKDQLFNPRTVGQLASELAGAVPDFDAQSFAQTALEGFAARELIQRLDWLADCAELQLAPDFPTMADQLEAAMPPILDPAKTDDDFGQFIHCLPGILAVRHGLENHRERALDLLHAATQRFSMEFYIRPFINRWPEETMARLHLWAKDSNYHVRRLVSEGTRPKLPWAKSITLKPGEALPLLDILHADPTRFVTRSIANHLNDIGKTDPDAVLKSLAEWRKRNAQQTKELDWMHRHALRSLIKQGHAGAMEALGYARDVEVTGAVQLATSDVAIGSLLEFEVRLTSPKNAPVIVDYALWLTKSNGQQAPKVFKLKTTKLAGGEPLTLRKSHKLKGDATTFTLYPGPAKLAVQVNGRVIAQCPFRLTEG